MQISREALIKYFRLNAKTFAQFQEEGHVSVTIELPEVIEIED